MKILGLRDGKLEKANMCLIYMRVIMISDISNVQVNEGPPGRMMVKIYHHVMKLARTEAFLYWTKSTQIA